MGFGGGNSGNVSISGASDVALNNPSNNQVLSYDTTSLKWKNASVTGSAVASPIYVIYYDTGSASWRGQDGGAVPLVAPSGVLIRLVDKRGANVADYSGAKWDNVSDWMPIVA